MLLDTEQGVIDINLENLMADNFIEANRIKAVAYIIEIDGNDEMQTIGENKTFEQICFDYFLSEGVLCIRPIFLNQELLSTTFKNIKSGDYVVDDGFNFYKGIVLDISTKIDDIKNGYWYCKDAFDVPFFDGVEEKNIRSISWEEFLEDDYYNVNLHKSKRKELQAFFNQDFINKVKKFYKKWGGPSVFLDPNMYNMIEKTWSEPKKYLWTYNFYYANSEPLKNENDMKTDLNQWEDISKSSDLDYIRYEIPEAIDSQKVKTNKKNKAIMENLKSKIKSQFIPEKVKGFKLSIEGVICMKSKDTEGEYIGINNDNELITYPENMCFDFPMYVMTKSYNDIKVGDIVDTGNSYAKVIKKNGGNSLSCLTFNGTNKNSKTATDFLLKQPLVKVLINLFDGNIGLGNGQTNELALAMALSDTNEIGEGDTFAKIMMLSQLANGNKSGQSNSISPILLSMIFNKEGQGDLSSFEDIIMASAISGGNNIFGNLFGQANVNAKPDNNYENELAELKQNYEALLKEVQKEKKEDKTAKKK